MRHLDLGTVPYQESQAVYHAVAACMSPEDPPTLITVRPDRAYVCVGYHQAASREIEREVCERDGIPVGRRMVGGGAVYLDGDQVFWHLVLPGSQHSPLDLYGRFLPAQVRAYRRIGIEAQVRPVNDIVVGARKIGGTGAASIGQASVLVGSILFDFDVAAMARVLRVPSEKFRDKVAQGMRDYMTTVRRELGAAGPTREEATALLVSEFAAVLGEEIWPGTLSAAERESLREHARLLFDPDFVYRDEGWIQPGVKIREGVRVYEGVHKAPGGLIRLIFRERDGRFDDVLLTGDFFAEPRDGLSRVGQALLGRPTERQAFMEAVESALEEVRIPAVCAGDFEQAFTAALARGEALA